MNESIKATAAAVVLLAVLLVSSVAVTDSVAADTAKVEGDVNGDGVVNSQDVYILSHYLAGFTDGVDADDLDVNGDGKVSMADQLLVEKAYSASTSVVAVSAGSGGSVSSTESSRGTSYTVSGATLKVTDGWTTVTYTATADSAHNFQAWTSGTAKLSDGTHKLTADTAITAAFANKTYTVTAVAGTGGNIEPSSAIAGTAYSTNENKLTVTGGTVSRTYTATASTGYSFDHWETASLTLVDGTNYTLSAATQVKAVFKEKATASTYTFGLIYDANGGTGAPDAQYSDSIAGSHTFTVSASDGMKRSGYTFLGWGLASDATSPTDVSKGITVSTDDTQDGQGRYVKTVYAVWEKQSGTSANADDDYTTKASVIVFVFIVVIGITAALIVRR